jgi:hypothetical protein
MKTYKHLWEKFISKENFELAYKHAIKGKSKQKQIIEFKKNKEENLEKVRQLVISGQFHTSPYRSKTIYEPKKREIYILPFSPDRIVQHALINILKPILTNLFIENTFSCIEGRGQLTASIKCSEYVRKYKYCLKCDIRKFYPSINHDILSNKFHRITKDKSFIAIIDDIIYSFNGDTNCPIGNFASQWFGNFYLSFLDNFVLHNLKCGAYERYCDDFMLFSNNKQYLNSCRYKIKLFLETELKLEFSKSNIFNTKQGVDFCGYRHFGKYVLMRKSTVKRIKKKFNKIRKIQCYNIEKLKQQIASTKGWLKHSNSYHLLQKLGFDNLLAT